MNERRTAGPARARTLGRMLGLAGALGLLGSLAAGCNAVGIAGSGNVVSTPGPTAPFTEIHVSSAFQVSLALAHEQSVVIRVDDNIVDRLDVGVSDETLRIGLKPGVSVHDVTLEASVTATSLRSIGLSGASTLRLKNELTGETLSVNESGASRLFGSVKVSSSTLEISGASNATLAGSADQANVTASGAGVLTAGQLKVDDLTIDLSGASSATVYVTGTISAGASGASALRYTGNPTFTRKDVSGASTIQPA